MIAEYNIEMVRGDTLAIDVSVEGDIGTVTAVAMTARRQATDTTLFELGIGTGITAVTGGWTIRIPPSATAQAAAGLYKYDVQLTVGNDIYTPLRGTLRLYEDQTRAVSS